MIKANPAIALKGSLCEGDAAAEAVTERVYAEAVEERLPFRRTEFTNKTKKGYRFF